MSSHLRFSLVLSALTVAALGGVCFNEFIDLDDIPYITQNPNVKGGLTGENIRWAFSTTFANFWQPVTWLSLQLDATIYGPSAAWGFHLTNLLFHLANVLLLYRLLAYLTQQPWPSFWVAALFAVHPLHVESVAWAVERKDVLSTFFWLLATSAYVWYAEAPSWRRMAAVAVLFALGVMTKPMVVTFPFTLLLLDYWPMRRWPRGDTISRFAPASALRLVLEKTPLFLLAFAGASGVYLIKRQLGEVQDFSLVSRLMNAITSYGWYLWKTMVPFHHGLFYSHQRDDWDRVSAILSGLTLASITFGVVLNARKHPYLLVGWFWFVGTLVPVIGLVQVADQARADRFVYVPHIGLFVALVWFLVVLIERRRWSPMPSGLVAATVVMVLSVLTWFQVRRWKDSITIWEHTMRVTNGDPRAVLNLSLELLRNANPANLERALIVLREFLSARESADIHHAAGLVLGRLQRNEDAVTHLRRSLEMAPDQPKIRNDLGHMLLRLGNITEAIEQFTQILEETPNDANTHHNMGLALMKVGETEQAIVHFRLALEGVDDLTGVLTQLGIALLKSGKPDSAETSFREALQLEPENKPLKYLLGLALLRQGKVNQSLPPLREAAPHNRLCRSAYAYALFLNGDKTAAQTEYDAITLLHPNWTTEFAEAAVNLVTRADAKLRDPREAKEMALQACQSNDFRNPTLLDALAVTQAALGEFEAAIKTTSDARKRAEGQPELERRLDERLLLYAKKQPVPPKPN